MSSTRSEATLCSRCKKAVFQPRVNVNSSDLYSKLRSEYGAFALDRQEAEDIIISCDRDLEDSEREVMRLQSQIMFIQEQQKRLRAYKTKIHSLSSPIRKIPNEILASIFDSACEAQWNLLQEFPWNLDGELKPTKLTSPILSYIPALSLSATCTRWRSLALSSPNLWSRLKLEITSGEIAPVGVHDLDSFVATVKLFFERSGKHNLEIDLDIRGEETDQSPSVLELLFEHSQRWKAFHMAGSYTISTYLIDQPMNPPDFPLLEKLDIENNAEDRGDLDLFRNSPKLWDLSLYTLVPSQIDWSRVTNMEICAAYGQVDKILDICPNLTTLSLMECKGLEWESIYPCLPPRISNTIEALAIVVDGCDTPEGLLETVLSSFTLPTLDKLHINRVADDQERYDRKWPKNLFASFVTRSSCSTTTFTLTAVGLSDTDLISALQLLPSLVSLEISDLEVLPNISPITSTFIASLHSSDPHSPLVPRLRNLHLDYDGTDFDDVAFISVISSRWMPDSNYAEMIGVDCLQSVELCFHEREVDLTV